MNSIVDIGSARVNSFIASKYNGFISVRGILETFLDNEGNMTKIIGLHTERAQKVGQQSKTTLLQLCDGDHCLIVQLPVGGNLPSGLLNFLNLPYITFVGIGINKTLMNLESEFGLTCNNAVEIGPSSWDLLNKTEEKCRIVRQFVSFSSNPFCTLSPFVSFKYQTSAVFEDWGSYRLSQKQINLATANAYFAFKIGNVLMAEY
ncbi:unnamed protein product [Arabidopsis lyrata]|uniref:3'-5' exonuclease domain-containing protein n=1 Tax=Arabidopsis lyrata subsp. lyrata TaxID=81972 RepID=D7KT25_ARALL|nr:uncharacterized protein LOC9323058 [Arabidopsis lyrata subsp. lyrata]EFH63252.1 hypothetical protein ARALYDRAFT_894216 [Arabidopsis lyrata subsp. lyrata]CAH8269498.1 unnamed protein product [Arabidopsis lyrata]|eukprot:XP_002886993.1 uncharacterized protein LOC9323058 [Arabidopsis lyrata subsp. lyrata]